MSFPKFVKRLQSGLEILRSSFKSSDGTRGVVNGPHPSFIKFENKTHHGTVAYLASALELVSFWKMQDDAHLTELPVSKDEDISIAMDSLQETVRASNAAYVTKRAPKQLKIFDKIESVGTEITFRCVDCRGCKRCKSGPQFESMSIQDEVENSLIEKCVSVDIQLAIATAKLPFLLDPEKHLAPNEHIAQKVL